VPIKLPSDAAVYSPSEPEFPLEDEEQTGFNQLQATVVDSAKKLVAYPGKIFEALTSENAPIQFAELPELSDMPAAEMPSFSSRLAAEAQAMLTTDDLGKAEILRDTYEDHPKYGGMFIDDYGLPIMMWNDIPYYINKPGFGGPDFMTMLGEITKYIPATKFVSGGRTVAARAGRGLGAYSATETASKAGEAQITPETVSRRDQTLGEAAEEVTTSALRDVAIDAALPKVLEKTGQGLRYLADKSGNVAKRTYEVAKKLSPFPQITPEIIQKSRFPLTLGQKYSPLQTGRDPQYTPQLATEDILRRGGLEDPAASALRKFDDAQLDLIRKEALALQDEMGAGVVPLGGVYANIPDVAGEEVQKLISDKADLTSDQAAEIYLRLKNVQDDRRPKFGPKAFQLITRKMMDYVTVQEKLLPTLLQPGPLKDTYAALKKFNKIASHPRFKDQSIDRIEQFRKNLQNQIKNVERGSDDFRIMVNMKNQLDEGVDESITRGFVSGDEDFIEDLRRAQGLYSEYNALIGGRNIPALRRLPKKEAAVKKVLLTLGDKDFRPLEVVNLLFGRNKFSPDNSMPLVIDELRRVLTDEEFLRVQSLLKDGILTKAFSGAGGDITRKGLVTNFNQIFNSQRDLIEKLFTKDEIDQIISLRDDILPTIAAENKRNPSATAYVIQSILEKSGLLNFPRYSPSLAIAGKILDEGQEAVKAGQKMKAVQTAIKGQLSAYQAPLLTAPVQAKLRELTREDAPPPEMTEEDRQLLESRIQEMQEPEYREVVSPVDQADAFEEDEQPSAQVEMPTFEPLPQTARPTIRPPMPSPTLLRSPENQELAMRRQLQGGIAGLG
jgi:hypothetical protein